MNKPVAVIILSILINFSFLGCKDSNKKSTAQNSEIKKNNSIESQTEQLLCFRNEFLFKNDSEMKDVQELNLRIDKEKVKGIYNWLPAEKDQRKGYLTGIIKDNIINAIYIFSQEGIQDSTSITISLLDNRAIIKGGSAESGLDASITMIDCNNSTPQNL